MLGNVEFELSSKKMIFMGNLSAPIVAIQNGRGKQKEERMYNQENEARLTQSFVKFLVESRFPFPTHILLGYSFSLPLLSSLDCPAEKRLTVNYDSKFCKMIEF